MWVRYFKHWVSFKRAWVRFLMPLVGFAKVWLEMSLTQLCIVHSGKYSSISELRNVPNPTYSVHSGKHSTVSVRLETCTQTHNNTTWGPGVSINLQTCFNCICRGNL